MILNNKLVRHIIKQSKKKHYTYGLCYEDGTPFYIGKGQRDRIFHHESHARNHDRKPWNPHKIRVIRKMWKNKKQVMYKIYGFYNDTTPAENKEEELIESIGIDNLTNITSGKDGHTKWSVKSRKTISESMKLAHKNDPALAKRNGIAIRNAIKKDPTIRDRLSEGAKKRFSNSNERIKQSKRIKQTFIDDPTLKSRQLKTLNDRFNNDPTLRDKYKQTAIKLYNEHPEIKEKISNSLKNKYKNNPLIQKKKGKSRTESNKKKRIVRERCLEIIKKYNLDIIPPNGYQRLETFIEFEKHLLGLI